MPLTPRPFTQRVACLRCRAHRDLTLSAGCLVCGAVACDPVPLNRADLCDAIAQAEHQLALWRAELAALDGAQQRRSA
jgi:hypothetical protein